MNGPFDKQDEEGFDVSGQNATVPSLGGDTVVMLRETRAERATLGCLLEHSLGQVG